MKLPIYLDYNATTPVDQRVLEAMLPFFSDDFGNAASRHHAYGRRAEKAVERARLQVAQLIGAEPRDIVFTSGSTEGNNLAIKGAAQRYAEQGRHIVTAVHEHRSVVDPCRRLEQESYKVTWLRPDERGVISAEQVAQAIRPDTILVSIMWANNEIGSINPVPQIGAVCKEHQVIFHTDATQWVGKMPTNVLEAGVDLLTATAHKMYGPKGVGLLYVRRRRPHVRLAPLLDGGGHERGLRSGTLNVPGIVGLGQAAEICRQVMQDEATRISRLRDRLETGILARLQDVRINSRRGHRLPNTLNVSFAGVKSEALMGAMEQIAVSSAAACSSAAGEPSYVLAALGLSEDLADGSIRFSLGRFTTDQEIECTIEQVIRAVIMLRKTSAICETA